MRPDDKLKIIPTKFDYIFAIFAALWASLIVVCIPDFIGGYRFAQDALNWRIAWYFFGPILLLCFVYVLAFKGNPIRLAKRASAPLYIAIRYIIKLTFLSIIFSLLYAITMEHFFALPTLLFGAPRSSYVVLREVEQTCKYIVQCGTKEKRIDYRFPDDRGSDIYFNSPIFPIFHFHILPSEEVKNAAPGTCLELDGPTTVFGVWVKNVVVVQSSFCKQAAGRRRLRGRIKGTGAIKQLPT